MGMTGLGLAISCQLSLTANWQSLIQVMIPIMPQQLLHIQGQYNGEAFGDLMAFKPILSNNGIIQADESR